MLDLDLALLALLRFFALAATAEVLAIDAVGTVTTIVPVPGWTGTNVIVTVPFEFETMLWIVKPLLGTGGGGGGGGGGGAIVTGFFLHGVVGVVRSVSGGQGGMPSELSLMISVSFASSVLVPSSAVIACPPVSAAQYSQ